MVSGFDIAPVSHTAHYMIFLGLAWVVSYMGSFYAPQAFLNSIAHRFTNPPLAVPTQVSTSAIAPLSSTASFDHSSNSLLRWLPRPERLRGFRVAVAPSVTVVQTSPSPQATAVKSAESKAGADKPSLVGVFKQCISLGQAHTVRDNPRTTGFQVRVKGQAIAELPTQAGAAKLARRLREVLETPGFNPLTLQPTRVEGLPAGKAGQRSLLFTIDPVLEQNLRRSGDLVAIDWINNLRTVLGVAPLPLVQAQAQLYSLADTKRSLSGTASWYGPYFHNRLTAAGERFDQNDLTAAHPSLPFDTYLKVTNQKSGNSVIVRINDRGPYVGKRSLDLSRQAARCIDSETAGVVPYSAIIMHSVEAEASTAQASLQPAPANFSPASTQLSVTQKLARVDSK